MDRTLLKYNLQFFGDKDNDNGADTDSQDNNSDDSSNAGNADNPEIDASAFADLISEKDKEIQQLQQDVTELKKSNAQLLLRISANNKTDKTFDDNLLELTGCKPRKE